MAEKDKKVSTRVPQASGKKPSASAVERAPSSAKTARAQRNVTSKQNVIKSSNNVYKKGKLSKNARFSPRKIKWTPIIIIACVLATVIFALIFGNHLKELVKNSQSTTSPAGDSSSLVPPSADKVSPHQKLRAYFADLTGADPEKSLSEQTSNAREKGNALFVNIKSDENELVYTSDKAEELGFIAKENLTLTRLNNHFEYYDDFAVGYFLSDFSANLDTEEALKLQMNEILVLKEATDKAFDQIIIEFSDSFTKNNLIHYQTYLLNLKLACPEVPIGIKLSKSFLTNSDNAGSIASLLEIADFFALDFENQTPHEIKTDLVSIIYFAERYDCVIMLSGDDEGLLEEKTAILEDKGIDNYIIK